MDSSFSKETFVEQAVTFSFEMDGRLVVIEHVPARVCQETGERLFAPETVERLQTIAWHKKNPRRVIQTPVFEFSDVSS